MTNETSNNISGGLYRLNVRASATYEVPPVKGLNIQGTYSYFIISDSPVKGLNIQSTYSINNYKRLVVFPVKGLNIQGTYSAGAVA